MHKKSLILWIGFYLISLNLAHAQKQMGLEEILDLVKTENLSLQKKANEVELAQIDKEKSNAVFLPNVTLSYNAMRTNDPLNVFGTKLKQKKVTQQDFLPDLLNHPSSIGNYGFVLRVEQPLINMDGIYFRNAADHQIDAQKHQAQRQEDYLILQTKNLYAQLQLLYAAQKVLNQAKITAAANVKMVKNLQRQGYAKPADVWATQIRLTDTENQLLDNKLNIENLSDQLHYLMGSDEHSSILPLNELKEPDDTKLDSSEKIQTRPDVLAYKEGIAAREEMIKAQKAKMLPRLNAFGQFETNDDQITGMDALNYMVGLQLSWNLFNSNKNRKDLLKSKTELTGANLEYQDYIAKSKTELNKVKRDIENDWAKIALAKKAVEQANESYRIRENRYKEGLEKTTDLLQDQTQKSQKHLEYLQVVYQLKTALAYLDFLTAKSKSN